MSYPNMDEEEIDLLSERYVDLLEELGQIEDILNMSPSGDVEDLYEINDILFGVIDALIPELVKEEETDQEVRYKEFLKKSANKKSPEAVRKKRAEKIGEIKKP